VTDCDSKFVLKVKGISYRCRGNGEGAERVISCVSTKTLSRSGDAEIFVEYVKRFNGAKTARKGVDPASSFRIKGFVGSGDAERGLSNVIFAEKGRREEIRDERGGGSGDAREEGGAQDGFDVVNKELFSSQ
jgi:hypothetical protein